MFATFMKVVGGIIGIVVFAVLVALALGRVSCKETMVIVPPNPDAGAPLPQPPNQVCMDPETAERCFAALKEKEDRARCAACVPDAGAPAPKPDLGVAPPRKAQIEPPVAPKPATRVARATCNPRRRACPAMPSGVVDELDIVEELVPTGPIRRH